MYVVSHVQNVFHTCVVGWPVKCEDSEGTALTLAFTIHPGSIRGELQNPTDYIHNPNGPTYQPKWTRISTVNMQI